ncbi:hypothetical protein K435DRAFT_587293, partial [Dendrothele bispora CBS 962.96]
IIWDILTNADDEIELYFNRKFGLPIVAYTFCRIASIFYALAHTLYVVLDISDCERVEFILPVSFVVCSCSVTFLLLLRVRAIFHDNRNFKMFFTICWLIATGCSGLDFLFIEGEQSILDSRMCNFKNTRPVFGIVSICVLFVFDTMVYLAISFRLFKIFRFERQLGGPGLQRNASSLFTGKFLPAFSRSFLRDGQVFYV